MNDSFPEPQGSAPPGRSTRVDGDGAARIACPHARPQPVHRAIAVVLAAALTLYGTHLLASHPFDSRRPGYLAVREPLPPRFQEDLSPVTHPTRPAPGAPGDPTLAPVPAPAAPAPASVSAEPAPPAATEGPANPTPAAAPAPGAKTQPRLLLEPPAAPVRPEDFLPYFQAPGTSERPDGSTFVLPPVRSTGDLPSSSATYTQSLH